MSSRSAASVLAATTKRCAAPTPTASRLPMHSRSSFSTTPHNQKTTLLRQKMYKYMTSMRGSKFQTEIEAPTYLGDLPNQPFPLNPFFRSEAVLTDSKKNAIYDMVTREKQSLKAVSAKHGVDVRRVAAVIRLGAIERDWRAKGKQLATPYAKALRRYLPQTFPDEQHEPINELHVHKLTMQQLFVPVSESREFSRKDAAKAFHRSMLSPDERSPHPELITMEKDVLRQMKRGDALQKFRNTTRAQEDAMLAREEQRRVEEENKTARIETPRFEFRFKDVVIDVAGKSGRGRKAIGMRYGVPFNDRKKGAVKIPTSMP